MNYENLEKLSLADLIALKNYLLTDRVPYIKNPISEFEDDSGEYGDMIRVCEETAAAIDGIITDRLIEINPEYNL